MAAALAKVAKIMKKIYFAIVWISLVFFPLYTDWGHAAAISSEESKRILTGIFSKYIPIYTKYRGVESTSRNVIREYDPKTNVLKSTTEVVLRRKDYFYEKPEIKPLSLKKDGKETDPSGYRSWETKPGYLVFDKNGNDHYLFKIVDTRIINKRECYRIEVLPKKMTSRHFQGKIYCAVDTLDIVQTVGGAADLDFPIKYFWSEFDYTLVNKVPVAQSGTLKVRIDIPVIYPDTLIVTATTIIESRLLE